MSLFVPALRITMLFLNVYESYKTLKPPPPSVRDPTRPSVRAMTQRKRDMKGCLAVWIVWCCFAAYERVIESLVSLFIPFYDEFKSMFMLFLIVTRARGAEPIFLHILRPIVKPYTGTLDGSLDLVRMTGDFIFALSAFPIHSAITWWQKRTKARLEDSDSDSETSSQSSAPAARAALSAEVAQHEIWVPPPQAFESEDEELNEAVDAPPEILDLTQEERAVEEWRKYPAFPSAYPASPLTTHSQLASTTISFSAHIYPPIPETQSEQDFHRSLLLSRNTMNPSYANDLSDQNPHLYGIQHVASTAAASNTLASPTEHDSLSDDSMEDEEDIFNMTLRTPLPPHGAARSRLMAKLSIPGPLASAASEQSTAIPSAHTNLSFRTSGAWSESSPSTESVSPAESPSSAIDLERTIGPGLVRSRVQQMEEDFEDDDASTLSKNSQSDATTKRPGSVRKRKVSSHLQLQELSATSDTADEDSEVPSPGSGEEKEDVYVPGEQKTPEVKRRRLASTRKASVSSAKAIHPRIVPRRPLATRSVDPKPAKGGLLASSVPSVGKSSRAAAKPIAPTTTGSRAAKKGPSATGSRSNSASTSSSSSSLARTTRRAGASSLKTTKDP
ncbi:hypothetical protein EST38_g6475 [Candolleomyces aberdarensis]|uniref:Protein YOP1 n=1 Tax=Candolleomyces aberdarensis TaxID=2316362 RepID=A0A4Q2DHZ0_9AGAR|nr:hypothetical protein EST38_g6475 [Candolleomyces aberdarensis]